VGGGCPPRPPKPPAPLIEAFPRELVALKQWVGWRYGHRGDDPKWTKVLYNPNAPGRKGKSNDPDTWGSFDLTWKQYLTYGGGYWDGIGLVFTREDPYWGVDFDKILRGEVVAPWAAPILEKIRATYGEISPSLSGVKFIGKGSFPKDREDEFLTGKKRGELGDDKDVAIEIYWELRFFTITGRSFCGISEVVELPIVGEEVYRFAKDRPNKAPRKARRPRIVVPMGDVPADGEPRDASEDVAEGYSPLPWWIEKQVIWYLDFRPPSIEGKEGSGVLYGTVINAGPGFNITKADCYRLIQAHYNVEGRCVPPWSDWEIWHKIDDAYANEPDRGWKIDYSWRLMEGEPSLGDDVDPTDGDEPEEEGGEEQPGPPPEADGTPSEVRIVPRWDAAELPTEGKGLVIIGEDADRSLHIRAFFRDGTAQESVSLQRDGMPFLVFSDLSGQVIEEKGPVIPRHKIVALMMLWQRALKCRPPNGVTDAQRDLFLEDVRTIFGGDEPPPEANGQAPAKGKGKGKGRRKGKKSLEELLQQLGMPEDFPVVIINTRDPMAGMKSWTPAALDALAKMNEKYPRIYQTGGALSRVRVGDLGMPHTIEVLSENALRGVMDRSACWGIQYESSMEWGPPRLDIVRDVMALEFYDPTAFPRLTHVTTCPTFLPDGELITEPAYSPRGHFYYAPSADLCGLDVPEQPLADQVDDALHLILNDLLVDFVFANAASKAHAVALLLQPFLRAMIEGPTPNYHISAAVEGTGKSLLANAMSYPALGRRLELNPQKEDEAEWRKAITAALLTGGSHFYIDNLNNPRGFDGAASEVSSGVLSALWTGDIWQDRILGVSKNVKIPIVHTFITSGNNVRFSRELERRNVNIELVATCENPSTRTGFHHDPLIDWARDKRQELVRACLILIQSWIAQKMPMGTEVAGSFPRYAQVMGGVLGAIGVPGFLTNRVMRIRQNYDAERWSALVAHWDLLYTTLVPDPRSPHDLIVASQPVSTKDLHDLITGDADLQEVFHGVLGDGSAVSQRQKLGIALAGMNGRVISYQKDKDTRVERRLVKCEAVTVGKSAVWKLRDPSKIDDLDDGAPTMPGVKTDLSFQVDRASGEAPDGDKVPF
jgi:hypothetical protein